MFGDASETQVALESHKFSKRELDRALFDAVLGRYDNSTVIKLLLDAGADVNARGQDDIPPFLAERYCSPMQSACVVGRRS